MSAFGADRVRIELCDVMAFGADDGLHRHQAAEIWLGDGQGSIRRARKPAATLIADSRAEVLRRLADWIDNRHDPSLNVLAAEFGEMKAGKRESS